MALKKVIVQDNGITTEYHKVNRVSLIDRNGEYPSDEKFPICINATVISFLNEEYREAGHSISSEIYTFTLDEGEADRELRSLVYSKLKELDTFAGAEDC